MIDAWRRLELRVGSVDPDRKDPTVVVSKGPNNGRLYIPSARFPQHSTSLSKPLGHLPEGIVDTHYRLPVVLVIPQTLEMVPIGSVFGFAISEVVLLRWVVVEAPAMHQRLRPAAAFGD